ncbi:MAG: hypothetical protein JSR18_02665 [Proteobacteria bacterium]|nr:hypothetical protein [Pseudomonadota bacterium]
MSRSFPGKLNLFQRTMRRWRSLAPYNAVHAAEVTGAFDEQQVIAAIDAVLARRGIAAHTLDRRARRFAWAATPAAAPTLAVMAADGAPDGVLAAQVGRELNAPFAAGQPLRFFAVTEPGRYTVGIAYDHYVAGGDSIAELLGEIVDALTPGTPTPPGAPPALYPPTYAHLWRTHPRALLHAMAAMRALVRDVGRAMRPRDADVARTHNEFALFRLDAHELAALKARARTAGATLHDLVLAVLLTVVAPIAGTQRAGSRRPDVAVAAIVNIRRDMGAGHARDFGQFLASLRVVHPVPPDASLDALARDVAAVTRANREQRLYLRTLIGLAYAAVAWPLLSSARRQKFYAKHHPAWAGVSMLAVDAAWPARLGRARRYTRGVSTGPQTPAVLAISQTGDALSFGVSWRTSVHPGDLATRLESAFRAAARGA